MNLDRLNKINARSIHNAGPRYTPGIDSAAPNLEIRALEFALEGLMCSEIFQKKTVELHDNLKKAYDDLRRSLTIPYSKHVRPPSKLLKCLASLSQSLPGDGRAITLRGRSAIRRFGSSAQSLWNKLYEDQEKRREEMRKSTETSGTQSSQSDQTIEKLNSHIHQLQKCQSAISDTSEFLNSPACDLQYNNVALLLGSWGTGKTHFLCDLTARRSKSGRATLFILAKDFSPGQNAGKSLAGYTGLAESFEEVAKGLNTLGQARKERALLLIDGINESDHAIWRNSIGSIINTVNKYPYLGIVISCRQPFEQFIFRASDLKRVVTLSHRGFEDIEFDAQSDFFKYYKIPLPEIPLLAEEFSRPLTLKVLCEAFRDLPRQHKKKGFAGITSGQRGMTFVLERFVNKLASAIEAQMHLPPRFCWTLIKGDNRLRDPTLSGIAPCMATTMNEYISTEQCLAIIRARKETRSRKIAKSLLQRLTTGGLLLEDVRWRAKEQGGSLKVIRLPYQRFSDHIIARHILDALNTSSPSTIRKSLASPPLRHVFDFQHPNHPAFQFAGWVEALIVEFPERVKQSLPQDQRELFFYLPKPLQHLGAYYQPFVGGLFWRTGESITTQTDQIAGTYIWQKDVTLASRMIESMLGVATKPDHPYNARRLYVNLGKRKLSERDRHWTEFLRNRGHSSTVERLLRWFESGIPEGLSELTALNHIHLLSLILTSTDRLLRDRCTRALVTIGERVPSALFTHTITTLSFNDPYVPERMLAASYGAAMTLRCTTCLPEYKNA